MSEGALALAVDIGGTQLRVALVDEAGRIVRRASAPSLVLAGPAANVAAIVALAGALGLAEARERVVGVGIGAPGPLDSETGTIIDIPTLVGWTDFPLREAMEAAFGLPAILENDGIAAALGEWRYGAGADCRHLVYVTVSTGIGGGVIADGRVLHGRRGMAGHVGHISLASEGPRCSCGATGCFEALAAGPAFAAAARARGYADAPAVVAAARRGEAAALEVVDREAEILGRGFASLAHLFSPERIVMGGGVARSFDFLFPRIAAAYARHAMAPFRDVAILAAANGDNAGLVGAAALVDRRNPPISKIVARKNPG
jgi:glucokinase